MNSIFWSKRFAISVYSGFNNSDSSGASSVLSVTMHTDLALVLAQKSTIIVSCAWHAQSGSTPSTF
jgi:hypothetical protein